MTKQEFIEKAISNGVDNDSKNVWVVVDGYKYTTSIEDDFWDYFDEEEQPYSPLLLSRDLHRFKRMG